MHTKFFIIITLLLAVEQSLLCMKRERHSYRENLRNLQKSKHSSRENHKELQPKVEAEPPQVSSLFNLKSYDEIEHALKHGAKVDERNKLGETPLHYYVYKNCTDAVRLLLFHGASCSARDKNKNTPYHASVHEGEDMVYALMRNPQGGPKVYTDVFKAWQKSVDACSIALNRFNVVRDVRLIIAKKLLPEIQLLHLMVPVRSLLFFTGFYTEKERVLLLNQLVQQHIDSVHRVLLAKNVHNETPLQLAVNRQGRALHIAPPIGALHTATLNNNKDIIQAKYAEFLMLPIAPTTKVEIA